MDWDARAMHFHLLMVSIQEEPPGSIPDDMDAIRRWLGLPSGSVDADQTWRRVRPQIFAAWSLRETRWFNSGMMATLERSENYRHRYEPGTKKARKVLEENIKILTLSNSNPKPSLKSRANFFLPEWVQQDTWNSFEEMRRKIRKPLTDSARKLVIGKLESLRTSGNDPTTVLEQSIMHSWQGVFEVRSNGNGSGEKYAKREKAISRVLEELYGPDDENPDGGISELQAGRKS